MSRKTWAILTVFIVVAHGTALAQLRGGPGDTQSPEFWARQQTYIQERIEAAIEERGACRTKYNTTAFVRDCEASAERLRLYWVDRYGEATREYERLRPKTPSP